MNNNMICSNCGASNYSDSVFCSNCGKQLVNNSVQSNNNVNNQTNSINSSEGNILGILSLALFFMGSSLSVFFTERFSKLSSITGIFPMVGIVIMIYGRIKYPSNRLLKIAMWIIIICIALYLLLIILLFIWCYITCGNGDFFKWV